MITVSSQRNTDVCGYELARKKIGDCYIDNCAPIWPGIQLTCRLHGVRMHNTEDQYVKKVYEVCESSQGQRGCDITDQVFQVWCLFGATVAVQHHCKTLISWPEFTIELVSCFFSSKSMSSPCLVVKPCCMYYSSMTVITEPECKVAAIPLCHKFCVIKCTL